MLSKNKTFHVPSMHSHRHQFQQKIITIILLMVIFSFGLTMSGKEIKLFSIKFWNFIQIILSVVTELLYDLYTLIGSVLEAIFYILWLWIWKDKSSITFVNCYKLLWLTHHRTCFLVLVVIYSFESTVRTHIDGTWSCYWSLVGLTWTHSLLNHILFHERDVEGVEVADIIGHELDKTDNFIWIRFEMQYFLKLFRMFILNFFPIFFLDQYSYFDSNIYLIFKGKNASESIPDKFVVNSISVETFLQNSVWLEEDILDHLSLVAA